MEEPRWRGAWQGVPFDKLRMIGFSWPKEDHGP